MEFVSLLLGRFIPSVSETTIKCTVCTFKINQSDEKKNVQLFRRHTELGQSGLGSGRFQCPLNLTLTVSSLALELII